MQEGVGVLRTVTPLATGLLLIKYSRCTAPPGTWVEDLDITEAAALLLWETMKPTKRSLTSRRL